LKKNRTERQLLAFHTNKGNKFASWENHERETRTGGTQKEIQRGILAGALCSERELRILTRSTKQQQRPN
jgi:hypothetical protein